MPDENKKTTKVACIAPADKFRSLEIAGRDGRYSAKANCPAEINKIIGINIFFDNQEEEIII